MNPVDFPEKQVDLQRPQSMTDEECQPLPIFRTPDGQCISCWKASWLERLQVLLTGRVWLRVWSGMTQPPVAIHAKDPFVRPKKEPWWLGWKFPFTPR